MKAIVVEPASREGTEFYSIDKLKLSPKIIFASALRLLDASTRAANVSTQRR